MPAEIWEAHKTLSRMCVKDVPPDFVDFAHPDDYQAIDAPIKTHFFLVSNGSLQRHYVRISWKCANGRYVPLTFLLDTGLVEDVALSQRAWDALTELGVLPQGSPNTKNMVFAVQTEIGALECRRSPRCFEPLNVMGIRLVKKLGIRSTSDYVVCFAQHVQNL